MSGVDVDSNPTDVDPAGGGTAAVAGRAVRAWRPSRRAVRWPALAALVVAAWAVTVVAYLLHAAIVLPVLVLVATASLLRGGRLLDRLMIAAGLLLGVVCAGGLALSVWPWGLHPVPVAGTALTALAVIGVASGRRPALPRPRVTDLVPVVAALALAVLVTGPLRGRTPAGLLGVAVIGDDIGRHVTVFDGIGRLGGYLFLRPEAAGHVAMDGMITYPQGSHLVAALLDGFLRSGSGTNQDGLVVLQHYLWLACAGYVFLGLAVVWAAQWIAAASLTPGRGIALAAVLAMICAATELMRVLVLGYYAEIAGLGEMALLVALLARPLPRTRQQLAVVGSLLVALGFTYYLFLPLAGLATLIWLVRQRARLRRHRAFVVGTAVVVAPLAAVQPVLGVTVGHQASALLLPGPGFNHDFLLVLGCLVLAGLYPRRVFASSCWRGYLACGAPIVAATGGFIAVQRWMDLSSGYYARKLIELSVCVLVIGLGALTRLLPSPRTVVPRRAPLPRRTAAALPGVLVAVAAAAGFGLVAGDSPYRPFPNMGWANGWYEGKFRNDEFAGWLAEEYADAPRDGHAVSIAYFDKPLDGYMTTLFLTALQHRAGDARPAGLLDRPELLERAVTRIDAPVRIVVNSDLTLERARAVRARHPDRRIEIARSRRWAVAGS